MRQHAPVLADALARVYNAVAHARFRGRSRAEVFGAIYRENHWRDTTSASGPGSTLDQTAAVRAALPELCAQLGVTRLLDAPCGDLAWMSTLELPGVAYTGVDIVPELIAANAARFADRSFAVGDLVQGPLPAADLILCRDCLVHLSYADIRAALRTFKASGARYLLTTSFRAHPNRDIVTGNWRPLNLEAAPFALPAPLEAVDERCTEGDGRYADKSLLLFSLRDIRDDALSP